MKPGSYVPLFPFRTAGQRQGAVQDVVEQYEAYLGVSSARSHAIVYRSALEVLRANPEDAALLAISGVLAIDIYLHGFGGSPVSIDQAWLALEKARALAPANPLVQFSSGFLALTQGDMGIAGQCGRELLNAFGDDETLAAQGA